MGSLEMYTHVILMPELHKFLVLIFIGYIYLFIYA